MPPSHMLGEKPPGLTKRKRLPDFTDQMKLQLLRIYISKAVDPLARSKKTKKLLTKAKGRRGRGVERDQIHKLVEGEKEGISLIDDDGEEWLLNLFSYDNMATLLTSRGLSSQAEGQGLLHFVDEYFSTYKFYSPAPSSQLPLTPQLVRQEEDSILELAMASLQAAKAEIEQPSDSLSQPQPKKEKAFIHEKTKCSALGCYLQHAPDPVERDMPGGRSKALAQLRLIKDKEDTEDIKIKMFNKENKSVGMKKLSEVAELDSWAVIFTRSGLRNHPGSLLSIADEYMKEHNLQKTANNFRTHKIAIVQKAINIVTGHVPGKEMSHIVGRFKFKCLLSIFDLSSI